MTLRELDHYRSWIRILLNHRPDLVTLGVCRAMEELLDTIERLVEENAALEQQVQRDEKATLQAHSRAD